MEEILGETIGNGYNNLTQVSFTVIVTHATDRASNTETVIKAFNTLFFISIVFFLSTITKFFISALFHADNMLSEIEHMFLRSK